MFNERGQASHITTLTHVESLLEAEKCLSAGEVDVVLLDLGLPDANGLTAVRRAQAAAAPAVLAIQARTKASSCHASYLPLRPP